MGFSLFEDNAEYGLGMYLGYSAVRNEVRQQLLQLKERLEGNDRNEKEKRLYDAICLWVINLLKPQEQGNGQKT